MKTITIGQRKGGNGKSTSALNLAHCFALEGKRVLVLDLDEQHNTTSALMPHTDTRYTLEDLLLNPQLGVREVAVPTAWEGVALIPASSQLSGVIRELDQELGSHLVLHEVLKAVTDWYDLCVIDTSPSLNILVINALCASDWLFIPLSSKYFSLQGLGQTMEAYQKVQSRLNPRLKILGIGFVIHDQRSNLSKEIIQKAQELYPDLLCRTVVHQNIKIEEAQVLKKSISVYAPTDKGALQYQALARELCERMGD